MAVYTGPIAHLKGKTAMLQPRTNGTVLAQFDDRESTRSGQPLVKTEEVLEYEPHARFATPQQVSLKQPPPDALGFGWHSFDAADFG